MSILRQSRFLVALAALVVIGAGCESDGHAADRPVQDAKVAAPEGRTMKLDHWKGKAGPAWKEYDKLLEEQKLEAASTFVEKQLEAARKAGDDEEVTRCLVRWTVLRQALHGWETSVRFLADQKWPDDPLAQSVLGLFYGNSLVTYAHGYSWEINRRERVEAKGPVDLKAWTMDQIYAEALRAALDVWKWRDVLGQAPASHIEEYVKPNTYPKDVRPTLRDAVTYLLIQGLADTQGWTPEQNNEVYRLDLAALLRGAAPAGADDPLASKDVHPLQKIAIALADLEQWHAGKGDKAAALEARLERLRRLHGSFTDAGDRARIVAELEATLKAAADVPWYAWGMGDLAEFVRQSDAPDANVKARAFAETGRKAYPGTPGAARCTSVIESIEQPDFSVESMISDLPSRRSIKVSARNLERVHFRAYRQDLFAHLEKSDDWSLWPSGRELAAITSGKPDREWTVDLPPTPDYRSHDTFVTPPLDAPGMWVVAVSGRKDFRESDNVKRAFTMIVSDLVLASRPQPRRLDVQVVSGSTGRPVEGAEVLLYKYDWRNRHRKGEGAKTKADGFASFSKTPGDSWFAAARKGDQVALDPSYVYFGGEPSHDRYLSALVFTDRSIYRPQQKVFWKVVAYEGRQGETRFSTLPDRNLIVTLVDPNGEVVATAPAKTNEFGTASGEFAVPGGRLLGRWNVRTDLDGGGASIRVEEYKRPTFEAKILDPEQPMRLNQPAELKGEARYYFGLPVTSGKVRWKVQRTPVYPWWWGWYGWGGGGARSQTIATGDTTLGEDGKFTAKFTPAADERNAASGGDVTYRYELSADVTDEGGETRSAERSFRLGFVAVEASLRLDQDFLFEKQGAPLTIVRSDLDGIPAPGKGSWRLTRLDGPAKALLPADQPVPEAPDAEGAVRTEGDRLRPRWSPNYEAGAVLRGWKDGELAGVGELTHDAKGEAVVKLPGLAEGAYRLAYETIDAFGAKYSTTKEFVVAGRRSSVPLPAFFAIESGSVPVGGVVRVLAATGLADQQVTIDLAREGTVFQRKVVQPGDAPIVEIPVTEAERGGFGVTVTLVRDHQLVQRVFPVFVPWDDKMLDVSFSTFRDRLRPGQKETWTVTVKPKKKDAAVTATELLAYMYDRSLDTFEPHSPADPLGLYPNRASSVWIRASLGEAPMQWLASNGFRQPAQSPSFDGDRLLFESGYGIGGMGYRNGGRRMMMKRAVMMDGVAESAAMPPPSPAAAPAPMAGMVAGEAAGQLAPGDKVAKAEEGKMDRDEPKDARGPSAEAPKEQMRSDFSETAFWKPHLIAGKDGSVAIEFQVPDSVTSWNVWVHALTKDLRAGSVHKEAKTVKDLMVRPYLPRFLREGDLADIKVVVNNASDKPMSGMVEFDIIDPSDGHSVLCDFAECPASAGGLKAKFESPAGGGSNVTFSLKTPARVGPIAFKVVAKTGDLSDGELRPIPVLPGRMHLAQSRFVTLKDKGSRTMKFADLAQGGDPSLINEQLVVTIDAQLFYQVLSALPYLVNYPYECVEQTMNRFLSTGIVGSMFKDYPAIEKMAARMSKRETQLEQFDAPDPNRKMALEETPWLRESRGGDKDADDLINVLDPRIVKAQRDSALDKLQKAQTSSGAFPWFPGGPPSPWMTLYLVYGFSKAVEFGVDVPKDMIAKAWGYLHRWYVTEIVGEMMAHDCCWESVTFLNYVLSNYPDLSWTGGVFTEAERKKMADFSFRHWKQHAPYVKGQLALTLHRMKRDKDALLVWESVMDSAKTAEDQGTFWAPEDRSWLWYNDTIETHAFALRTEMELKPDDPKLDGLVLWLFLNKKLNHWKSTRATAEVVYSLAHYLKKTGQLGAREEAIVSIGPDVTKFEFSPDEYTGKKNQVVVEGPKIDAATMSSIKVEKGTPGYLFASATWHFSTEKMPDEDRGDYLQVSRKFFKRVTTGKEVVLQPLAEGAKIQVGDEVEVQISLRAKHAMEYVHLRDPRGAGFEPASQVSRHRWDLGIYFYEEVRDSGNNYFFEQLPVGEYTFKHRLRAATAGTFKVSPATVQPMYAPEFTAYSSGTVIGIQGM